MERFANPTRPDCRTSVHAGSEAYIVERYLPVQRQSSSSHIGLSRISEKPKLPCTRSTKPAAVDPKIDFFVTGETSMHLCRLPNTNKRSVSVSVIAIPDGRIARCCVVFQTIDDQLDGGSRVRDEDKIELLRIRVEESKRAFANSVDTMPCQCRRRGCRVWVAVQICN